MKSQHSVSTSFSEHDRLENPRAVVLLLGWWGANPRHLAKYAQIYHSQDCLTIEAIADKYSILTHHDDTLDQCVLDAVHETAAVLRKLDGQVPIITHAFSNGGAYLVERLEILIQQARSTDKNRDLLLVAERLQGQLFDSAPAYPSSQSAIKAMPGVFASTFLRTLIALLFAIQAVYHWIRANIFKRPVDGLVFWKHMTQSKICRKQAFIYSSADDITNVERLEELIESRRKVNKETFVHRFDDSLHVQHLRQHPEKYQMIVKHFLDNVTAVKSE